jgi:hypothetical protein
MFMKLVVSFALTSFLPFPPPIPVLSVYLITGAYLGFGSQSENANHNLKPQFDQSADATKP